MPDGSRRRTSCNWDEVLQLLPGYDCYATAAPGDYFDPNEADRGVLFFEEYLPHVEGKQFAGNPIILEPWQKAVIGGFFGWKRSDGLRRYREGLLYIPRKNAKTTMCAGLANYGLCCDGEPGAQIYTAAKNEKQARLLFRIAKLMIINSPDLISRVRVLKNRIAVERMGSFIEPISRDKMASGAHGYNAHMAFIDELHTQPDGDLVDVISTSMGARQQPVMFSLTTADEERESICNEKYAYANAVRSGQIDDPSFLPVIYEAPADAIDHWDDPDVWRIANPNLGVSFEMDYIERACKQAKAIPRFENAFKRLHLNLRTRQSTVWLPMDAWPNGNGESLMGTEGPITREAIEEYLRGETCHVGIDLSHRRDVSAASFVFPRDLGGQTSYLLLTYYWLPEEALHDQGIPRSNREIYRTLVDRGWLELTPGKTQRFETIRERLLQMREQFDISSVAIDPWNSSQLMQMLLDDGFEAMAMRQGYASLSEPSKEFEAALVDGRLIHFGDPMLRWMAEGAAHREDPAGNIKPDKAHSSAKIDGIVAAIMGIARHLVDPNASDSPYNHRGIIRI